MIIDFDHMEVDVLMYIYEYLYYKFYTLKTTSNSTLRYFYYLFSSSLFYNKQIPN